MGLNRGTQEGLVALLWFVAAIATAYYNLHWGMTAFAMTMVCFSQFGSMIFSSMEMQMSRLYVTGVTGGAKREPSKS